MKEPLRYTASAESAHERTTLLLPPPFSSTTEYTEKPQRHNQHHQARHTHNVLHEDDDNDIIVARRGRLWKYKRAVLAVFTIVLFGFGARWWWSKPQITKVEIPIRIAVVGAGPAGISAAYALRNTRAARVTLIEKAPHIGGRLFLSSSLSSSVASSTQGKIHAEDLSGGNLVTLNPLLASQALKLLGQKRFQDGWKGERVVKVGFWDGKGFRMMQTRPVGKESWWDWFEQVKRYGRAVWNAKELPVGTMRAFRNMLQLRGSDEKESVESWIRLGKMGGAVGLTAKDRLQKNGITGAYVNDIVETVLQRQFGQSVEEVSDLTLSMGFEREFSSISAGGWTLGDLLQIFLDKSQGELQLNTKVTSFQKRKNEAIGKVEWHLNLNSTNTQIFDKVIIAAPWDTSRLLNSTTRESTEQIEYRSQWQTFVVSSTKLNASYFSMKEGTLPDHILPISSSDGLGPEMKGVKSIELVRTIFGPDAAPKAEAVSYLYSLASSGALPASTIETLFGKGVVRNVLSEEIQNAYPLLYHRSDGFGSFEVDEDGVWHTSVGEAVGSSVDWSWAVGQRVGELVAESLRERKGKALW